VSSLRKQAGQAGRAVDRLAAARVRLPILLGGCGIRSAIATIEKNENLTFVWELCGIGFFTKLILGRIAEVPTIIGYCALCFAPLFLIPARSYAYARVAAWFAVLALGGVAGYINNAVKGSMAFWHICCLASNILLWTLAREAAAAGQGYVKF
jgi:hypothetical protein